MLPVVVDGSYTLAPLRFVVYYAFVDDVMFSHNGPCGEKIAQQQNLLHQFQQKFAQR